MSVLLSIIIPTYNMEKYLPCCLDSVTREDVPNTLEVIVVNDGSKDNSLSIAREYEKKRSDIIRIIDKKNGNYGSCVNAAIPVCNGKYVRLLDADDWFDTKSLITLLNNLQDEDSDVLVSNYVKQYESGKVERIEPYTGCDRITRRLEEVKDFEYSKYFVMHTLTFKRTLINKCSLRHTEGISYTDMEYVYYPLMKAESISFYNISLYQYRIGRSGQTVSLESAAKHTKDKRIIVERMIHEVSPYSEGTTIRDIQKSLLASFIATYYWNVLVIKRREDNEYDELLEFDKQLFSSDKAVYDILDNYSCIGIKYIKNWRRSGSPKLPWRIYRLLRYFFR